ncbi:MAG: hypothetical protein WD991_01165 [Candidatus Paceibacterota bacterium]
MRLKYLLSGLFVLFTVFGVAHSVSRAQTSQSSILVNIAPENPAPFENITVSLNSYSANLDPVLITWSVNGSKILSEIGKKSFSTKVGGAGTETTIVAVIYLPAGSIEKRVILRPSALTLLWQATDSYVPPFYKGKALPIADSEIKVVAMPEIRSGGSLVNPKNMTYTWKKDYSNEQSASGYGKNYFVYQNDYLESSNNVEVTAATIDQRYSSRGGTDVGTFLPRISFYRKDAKMGIIFNRELSANHRINGEEIVVAVPYFISPKQIQIPSLIFSWAINGSAVSAPIGTKNIIPLKTVEGVSGVSKLRLEIENRNKIFQTASKEINIEF